MASSDIDPVFKRALRLLHLKSTDAEEQLRMMLDDAIKERYGNDKTVTKYLNNKLKEGDTSDSSLESSGAKKKPGSIKKSSHSKELLGSSMLSAPEKLPLSSVTEMDDYEEKEEEKDENDLAMEILEDDLACVVCRGMDIGARNQMIECMECKNLYHQECHQPPVAHTEIRNPTPTWYCANCKAAVNNRAASSNNLERYTSGLNLTGITASESADMQRTLTTSATKSSSSSFTSSSKSCGSLSQASAMPLSSSTLSSKSAISTTSGSKLVVPSVNTINTEKKLQIVKKKKTAKQQEKRKYSK